MAHSLLSPSKAKQWLLCPASVAASHDAPDDANIYADEGTAAHQLAAALLQLPDRQAREWIGKPIHVMEDDGSIRRTFVVDEDMADYVQAYVDAIRREPGELFVETRVDFSHVVGIPKQTGTADAIVIDTENKIIQVHDLKYGSGVPVYAEDDSGEINPQLALYALGAIAEYELAYTFEQVQMVIHQPRKEHVSMAVRTVAELKEWGEKVVRPAAQAAAEPFVYDEEKGEFQLAPQAKVQAYNPGVEQCRWCKAAATCPGLRDRNHKTMYEYFDDVPEVKDVASVPVAQLPTYEDLELMRTFVSAAEARIFAELQAGNDVPTWKLVQGRPGNRQWVPERVSDIEKLLTAKNSGIKKDAAYEPRKIISPAKAEKLLTKVNPKLWETLQSYIQRSEGKHTLAPETDKRPAIQTGNVSEMFDDVCDLI